MCGGEKIHHQINGENTAAFRVSLMNACSIGRNKRQAAKKISQHLMQKIKKTFRDVQRQHAMKIKAKGVISAPLVWQNGSANQWLFPNSLQSIRQTDLTNSWMSNYLFIWPIADRETCLVTLMKHQTEHITMMYSHYYCFVCACAYMHIYLYIHSLLNDQKIWKYTKQK